MAPVDFPVVAAVEKGVPQENRKLLLERQDGTVKSLLIFAHPHLEEGRAGA